LLLSDRWASGLAVGRSLGARYAKQYPNAEAELWGGKPPQDASEWAARLRERCRRDFEAGRVVQVHGFWLAETELRLCVVLHQTGA
jgi:hypothetical protein